MHKTNSILMQAPKTVIFETAANLELWPKIFPHYRYIRFSGAWALIATS